MAQIVWTEPALQDLDQIADYISLDNPDAAKKLVRQCFQRVEYLSQHPKMGKAVPVQYRITVSMEGYYTKTFTADFINGEISKVR